LNAPTSPKPFVALTYRNFRLLWTGQLVSMAGSTMQTAALLWHVSTLVEPSNRGLALGAVGLVRVIPIIVFSLIGGVVADALDRRRLMLVTQTGMALTASVLAWVAFTDVPAVWPVYLLAATSSAFGAFDNPARQSLVPNLVPREHLPNAISLNTIMFQLASVIGPSVGGLTIATLGVGWAYALNAASFLCVIGALAAMRGVPTHAVGAGSEVTLSAAIEGLKFVFQAPLIRFTMLLDFFATLFASATALLPIFAQDVLHVGARGYGLLSAAPSVGAMIASVVMVRAVEWIQRRGLAMLWAVTVYGLTTVAFGVSTSFALTFSCLALAGAADTVSMIVRNMIRQLTTPDHLRGRMTSVSMIFFMGGPQLGELEAGIVASLWGPVVSVVTGGLGCLAAVTWVGAKTPELRAYRK
jgi:MFS family permease